MSWKLQEKLTPVSVSFFVDSMEHSLPMIIVKAADVMDKWLGGSEAIIRSLFTRARSAAPCILFFDEIDAVGK